jgi:hypothetical protein
VGSRWIAKAMLLACVAGPGIFAGCSEVPHANPSGGALTPSPELPDRDGTQGNGLSIIQAVAFNPLHILPGRTIHAQVKAVDPQGNPVNLDYRWTVKARRIEATGNRFDVPHWAKRGDPVTVVVVANAGLASSEVFEHTARVANQRPRMKEIRILTREDEQEPQGVWHADPLAEDPDGDPLTFRYAWSVNGRESRDHRSTFNRSNTKRGDEIRLTAWASDGASESSPLSSAPFKVANSPPEILSQPPSLDDSGLFLYVVHAKDPDGDAQLHYALEEGPPGMTINPTSGELQWQATLKDAGEHAVRIAVDDGNGGTSHQGFYVQVEMILPPPRFGPRG